MACICTKTHMNEDANTYADILNANKDHAPNSASKGRREAEGNNELGLSQDGK